MVVFENVEKVRVAAQQGLRRGERTLRVWVLPCRLSDDSSGWNVPYLQIQCACQHTCRLPARLGCPRIRQKKKEEDCPTDVSSHPEQQHAHPSARAHHPPKYPARKNAPVCHGFKEKDRTRGPLLLGPLMTGVHARHLWLWR